jgi:hypothetical protein
MPTDDSGVVLREVRFDDCQAVSALKERYGLGSDSVEKWKWLWKDNPAILPDDQTPNMGWVLEADEGIVGYVGSIPMAYRFGERTYIAAAASAFVVDHAYRGNSLNLAASFMNQKNVDILLIASANEAASKVWRFFGARNVPQGQFDTVFYWILDPKAFINSAMKLKGYQPAMAWLSSLLLAWPLSVYISARGSRPRKARLDLETTRIAVGDVGCEFDDLWEKKLREERRFVGVRSSAALRWHFGGPDTRHKTTILGCFKSGRLAGYSVLKPHDVEQISLKRSRVVDLLVERNDPDVIDALLSAAYRHCVTAGYAALEFIGFPREIAEKVLSGRPWLRKLPNWRYLYKAVDRKDQETLNNELLWYACAFDGDASLS